MSNKYIITNKHNQVIDVADICTQDENGVVINNTRYPITPDNAWALHEVETVPLYKKTPFELCYVAANGFSANPDYVEIKSSEEEIAELKATISSQNEIIKEQAERNKLMEADQIAFQDFMLEQLAILQGGAV